MLAEATSIVDGARRKVVASMSTVEDQEQSSFDFSTASPDDVVLAARQQPSGVSKPDQDRGSAPGEPPPQHQMAKLNLEQSQGKASRSSKAAPRRAMQPKAPASRPITATGCRPMLTTTLLYSQPDCCRLQHC